MKKTGKDIKCKQCNEKFYAPGWRIKYGVKFCSQKCYDEWKKGKFPKHLPSFKKGHTPWNKGLRGFMAGEKNSNWSGGKNLEYNRAHVFLYTNYENANKCENRECQFLSFKCKELNNKFTWALKKGCEYEEKRENFYELCYSCHNKYDLKKDTIQKRIKTCKKTWNKKLK